MKEKNKERMLTKRVISSMTVLAMILSSLYVPQGTITAYANEEIKAEVNPQSGYSATQIVNGDFETSPWEDYIYNGVTYVRPDTRVTQEVKAIPNGVGKGWNTTEKKPYQGNLFEVWDVEGDLHGETKTDFSKNGKLFIEMNANNSAALYQDLYTKGGDVIKWTLQHADRANHGFQEQRIYVIIGAPERAEDGSIIAATGVNENIDTKIQEDGKAEYGYMAESGKMGVKGSTAFANLSESELDGLSVKRGDSKWCNAAGIYVVPENQDVTRFAFCADASSKKPEDEAKYLSGGNFLDNITFSTLIGNLQAVKQGDDSVDVTGYWGDENASKKLILEFGPEANPTKKEIVMSSVCNKNFVIKIPKDIIQDAEEIKVYHQDYESACRPIKIKHGHEWHYEQGSGDDANKIFAYCSSTAVQGTECPYHGSEKKVAITLNAESVTYSGDPYKGASVTDADGKSIDDIDVGIHYYMDDGTTETNAENSGAQDIGKAPKNVGNYVAKVELTKDETYTARKEFAIEKAEQPGTVSMADYNWGGIISIPAIPGLKDSPEVTYYYNTTESTTGGTEWKDINSTTLVPGTYYMYAVIPETDNCEECTTRAANFMVNNGVMKITANKVEVTYDGEGHGITVTGYPTGATVKYGTAQGTYDLTESPQFTNAGSEANKVYFEITANNYNTYRGSTTVKINPKEITDDMISLDSEDNSYAVTNTEITPAVTLKDGAVTLVNGEDKDYVLSGDVSKSAYGTYEITVTGKGNYTGTKTVTWNITDPNPPTGEIKTTKNSWNSFSNDSTFGHFFKGTQNITVAAQDGENESGLDKLYYHVSLTPFTSVDDLAQVEWTEISNGGNFNIDSNGKVYVYAKITDKVGNTAYLSTDGIVLYTDAEKLTPQISFTRTSAKDVTAQVILNGNTIAKIKNGTTELVKGTDYTLSADGATITFKETYLKTLSAGDYTLTVSYNPGGETYVDKGENDRPLDTTIALTVSEAQGGVSDISDISKTYDGKAVEAPDFTTTNNRGTNDSNAIIEYKVKGSDDSSYTTVKPINAGDYVVRITVKADGDHKQVSATAEFRIVPAKITVSVTDVKKHIGKDDPEFNYSVTDGILAEGDVLEGITLSRVSGETAGDYVISAVGQSGSNANYNITYVSGKLTIVGHTVVTDAAVAATCTKTGLTEGSHCSVCNKVIAAQEEVSALGHDWAGEWTVIKEATATEDGKQQTTCTRGCGQKKVKTIPAIGSTDEVSLQKDTEVAPEAPIDEASFDNEKSELLNAPSIFSGDEKQAIENGVNARVWLEVTKTDEDSIPADDKTKVTEEAKKIMGENPTITYFDVDLFKQIESGDKTQLHEPGIDIRVTVQIPDELINHDRTMVREYKIIRLHYDVGTGKSEVTVIGGDFDPQTSDFSFETDKFSTYALAYEDSAVPVNVIGVNLDKEEITLTKAGETAQLTAIVVPENANNRKVKWTTNDPEVAVVDENGKVTPVGNGTCDITVTTEDGGKTDVCKVTVNILEVTVTTAPTVTEEPTVTMEPTITTAPTVTVEPTVTTVPMVTTEPTKAPTITPAKMPTAVPKKTPEVKTAKQILLPQVSRKSAYSIKLSWNRIKGADGYIIYATTCGDYDYKLAKTIKSGKTTSCIIKKVKGKNVKDKHCKFRVRAYKQVKGKKKYIAVAGTVHLIADFHKTYGNAIKVSVKKSNISLKKGKTAIIKANVKMPKGKQQASHGEKIRYISSDEEVATVNKKGKIKAVGKGECKIYVVAVNGKHATVKVKVK